MAFRGCFTFFLLFLSCFLSTSTLARPHRPQTVVSIKNDLPKTTQEPLSISCDQASSSSDLKLGDLYNQTLKVDQNLECTAMWSRWFTTWDAYEANRDKGHHTILWLVKEDGFYHSWDGSKWKLLEFWGTD